MHLFTKAILFLTFRGCFRLLRLNLLIQEKNDFKLIILLKNKKKNKMWRARLFSILILAFFICNFSLGATEPYTPQIVNPLTQSWRWKQFPELEGKGIRNIFEGPDKTVWISFNDGIYEYNGYNWKIHNHENGLDSSPIEFVFVSKSGAIYATSPQSIFLYDGNQWVKKFEAPENVPFAFNNLTELSNGLIAAPSNRGLVILDERVKIFTSEQRMQSLKPHIKEVDWGLLPNELFPDEDFLDISDILLDHDGKIWLAVTMSNERGRLLTFDRSDLSKKHLSKYKVYSSTDKIKLGEAQRLLEARDGAIWVINSTYKTGISIWKEGVWEYLSLSDQFSGDEYMTDIVETDDGTIWIGSLGKLYAYKDKKWALYTAPDYPIPANRLILQKGKGNYIWVAGYKSKVSYLDFSSDHWISYEGLNFQIQDETTANWFLDIEGKIVRQKGVKWLAFGQEDGLMDMPIRVFQTKTGQIWAAGSHKGVASTAVLSGDKWERHLHPRLSWGIDYRAVFEDKSGALWFGGAVDHEVDKGQKGGVLKLVNPHSTLKEWTHYASGENGLEQSNVYGIGQSLDGRIWIGGGNLVGFDGKQWQRNVDSRLQQFVNVVTSNDGLLLAGSRYYGVFMFDGKTWSNYDNSNGLSGNTIISIDVVSANCIYAATENDICRFDGTNWVQNIFPPELNMELEGGMLLHDNEGANWINKSDRSWKRRALSHNKIRQGEEYSFAAHKYLPNNTPPETSITMFTEEVSPAGNTLIEWEGNDYFAQSAQKDLMFSYKLDNEEWSPYIKENHFTFINLKNGKYTLQVKARDLDLNEDPSPAIIEFEVLPPVWKQTWFLFLMLTFLTTLGIFEYRVRTKKRKLEILNTSLQQVNEKLKIKGHKITIQNQEILQQQKHILEQAKGLEYANKNLEERNAEIKQQKDKLEELVVKIEDLSKAKLSFFTNISHELRTPLTLITGPISQLIKDEHQLPASSRNKLYQIIERNSNRLLKLINQLLEFRRMERGKLEVNFHTISLPNFISENIGMFENLAVEKDIYLDFINESSQQQFTVDPDKIEKILVNLLSNAFKHTSAGGSIIVKMNKINSSEAKLPKVHETYLKIVVEDTGTGIPEEELKHIYKRFFASDQQQTDPNSSGIGLSYTKELVDLLHGEIRVESELGVGTHFEVYLPCIFAPEDTQVLSTVTPSHIVKKEVEALMKDFSKQQEIIPLSINEKSKQKKILIVEDHKDMQLFVESLLAEKFNVIKADNGLEGLQKAKIHNIDLILSDVMMPEMDGLEFCKQIKNNPATSHIPVLLLTAKVLEDNKIKGYAGGADAYLTKPFNPDLLLTLIDNLLHQREVLRQVFTRDFMLTPEKVKLTSPDEELLKKIVEIMEEHLEDSDFNVNQMCKMVHLSHMHFIRKVKQLTGKKPVDLLKTFRLKRAKDLLLQNKLSISEIAYMVGYDLPNSFSRTFKKEFGLSPKEFVARELAAQD